MKDFNTSLKTQSCGFLPRVGCVVAGVLETDDHAGSCSQIFIYLTADDNKVYVFGSTSNVSFLSHIHIIFVAFRVA